MTKTIRSTSALAAVLLLASFGVAHADVTPGWYGDLGVGATFTPRSTGEVPAGHRTSDFDTGYNILGGAGYAWADGYRVEGELFRSSAAVSATESAAGHNGGLANTDLFVNGLYDFNNGSIFTPYVGVGIGLGIPDASRIGPQADGGLLNDTDYQFAYQGIVGVSAQMDANWAVTADYRYVATLDPTFNSTAGNSGTFENASHNLILGVRYSFGAPAYVAPAPHAAAPTVRAAAAPKAAVAAVAQSYEVFFDFNKSTITPEAKSILTAAAKDFRAGKYVKIVVTGHTDTVGSASYNDKLSVARAKAVKTELVQDGVGINAIVTEGAGENGLLVPTADGVREAQNRRAEITFKK